MNRRGLLILRAVIAVFVGVAGLVMMVVCHPLITSVVNAFLAGSTDAVENFAVRAVEVFYVLMIFLAMIVTITTGE